MSLRRSADVVFNPNSDIYRVDRDIEWGIKVTHMDEFKFVAVFFRPVGGLQWQASVISGMDWQAEVVDMTLREWFIQKALPLLQKWLADTFPKLAGGSDPWLSLSVQLDGLIFQKLKVTENADGTLTATLVA